MLRSLSDRLFDSSFAYRHIRGLFHFGVRRSPVRRALELREGDRILDVGCGTGDFSPVADNPKVSYVGLDLNPEYVEVARRLYGTPNRTFEVGDIRTMNYPPKSFSKAILSGVMHHLTDAENEDLLRSISQIITDRLVILDLSPGGWHFINTLLCSMDRGRFPRRIGKQCELIQKVMDVESAENSFVRSGVQRYSLIVAKPRSAQQR